MAEQPQRSVEMRRVVPHEELQYNLLFRWFVGLNMDDPVWHPTTYTKNRDRLLAGEVAARYCQVEATSGRVSR